MDQFTIQMDRHQLEIIQAAMYEYVEKCGIDQIDEADMIVGLCQDALATKTSEGVEVFGWNL